MDPGIVKFLEDDEDEHGHSGADVDAFTAALNRDIGGPAATASASEPHAGDGILLQETAPAVPSTSATQWQQFTSQKEEEHQRYQQQNQRQEEQHKQEHQPDLEQQHRTGELPQQGKPIQQEQNQPNHLQQPEQNQHPDLEQQQPQVQPQPQSQPQPQLPHQVQLQQPQPQLPHQLQQSQAQPQLLQQVQIQQPQPQPQLPHQVQLQQPLQQPQQQLQQLQPQQSALNQVGSSTRRPNMASHSISFGSLIPMILPHISKEQSQRLQALYSRLRKNEVSKEDFLRATRNVVGDQMLVQAVRQMQIKQQTQSQSTQNAQPNQQQQQHSQSSPQQTVPQPNLHPQQLNQNLNQRNQRAPDYQLHPQTITSQAQADTCHSSLENNVQQSRQMGEPHPELTAQQMSQNSALNLNQIKHEVDRTMATFQPPNQQQQQHHHHHLQAPQTSYSLYGRGHGNYQSHAYPVGTSAAQPNAGKAMVQESQTRQAIIPQGGVQAQAGSSQLTTKAMGKYEISKVRSEPKRREDEERIARLQSGGASHLSGQTAIPQQQSIWSTTLDKDQAASAGLPSPVIVKQEVIDPNNDLQHKGQTQQPITDMQSTVKGASHVVPSHELLLDQEQPLLHGQPQTEVVDHQSVKTSGIASTNAPTTNQPVGSAGLHFDHAVQVVPVPVATSGISSTANLHHLLPMYGVPISGGHSPGISVQGQMRVQLPSTPSSTAGTQIRTPPKKPLIGQKKPFELAGPTTQLSSKKQKVAGGLIDQSIDQLNDVTAVSGVNLREEEEQLLSGPKEESRATEALRRVVQEEEEKLVLQKGPMRNKIAGIMAKCGIKNVSSDVERCLSMSVEERLRTMLSNLIRLSKQRVDLEKASHKIALTSDVRRQILLLNKKAKEDWEKKQAEEAEKLRKLNEAENIGVIDGEKDEARAKAQRAQKEEDDKMRANAANVAARAAVGGDDMLSKWKMMAEQARQKREGASDGVSNASDYKETSKKAMVSGLRSTGVPDHQEADNKGPNVTVTGSVRTLGRNLGSSSQTKAMRTISLKDVIALLEREPQMSKSTLLYRLYERGTDCVTEKVSENRNNESILP